MDEITNSETQVDMTTEHDAAIAEGEQLYGGFLDGLLKGSDMSRFLIMMILSKVGSRDTDRVMTFREDHIRAALRSIKITDPDDQARVVEKFRIWGDKGGDILDEIIAIKSGL